MPKNILIVEDDEFLRGLISKKLLAEDFKISVAVDGGEAVKKIKEEKPDLILLDLILPVMNGFEVLSKIKKDSSINSIPVVILSNLGEKEDIDKGLELGAIDYFVKAQLTPEEIVVKVKNIFEEK
ncbi:MAG: response regulator [Patescibacteria group bacterium]